MSDYMDDLEFANQQNILVARRFKLERDTLQDRNARLVAALEVADEAINPVDRGDISLDIWQARLKKATKIIRDALVNQQYTEKP